jgi:hypothetical protein
LDLTSDGLRLSVGEGPWGHKGSCKAEIEVDDDFARVLGFYYGKRFPLTDGDFEEGEVLPLDKLLGIGFTVPVEIQPLVSYLNAALQDVFGIEPSVRGSHGGSKAFVSYVLESRALGVAFSRLFGDEFSNKRLYGPLNSASDSILLAFLEGASIGHPNLLPNGDVSLQRFNLTSLFHLMRARGWEAKLALDEAEPSGMRLSYAFHILGGGEPNEGGLMVEEVQDTLRADELVYNLGVEHDHSYVAGGIVVQNCYLLSLGEPQVGRERLRHWASLPSPQPHLLKCSPFRTHSSASLVPLPARGTVLPPRNGLKRAELPTHRYTRCEPTPKVSPRPCTLQIDFEKRFGSSVGSVGVQAPPSALLVSTLPRADSKKGERSPDLPVISPFWHRNAAGARAFRARPAAGGRARAPNAPPSALLRIWPHFQRDPPPLQDSIRGIFEGLLNSAELSKWGGGLGIGITDIRSTSSVIRGTGGRSTGIVPMLRSFNELTRYVNQGGKRKGSIAVYLEPWHADVYDFLQLRMNTGHEHQRCGDLFTALWVPDLFMRRVQEDGKWTLFDPAVVRGLTSCHGDAFDAMYERFEGTPGLAFKTVRAKHLWGANLVSLVETGTPYVLFKDAVNAKSNQKHLGTIKSSNLCAGERERSPRCLGHPLLWHGCGLSARVSREVVLHDREVRERVWLQVFRVRYAEPCGAGR